MRKCGKKHNGRQTNTKKKYKKNTKNNEMTHQTLIVIVGGENFTKAKKSNEIYFCVSSDINNKNINL